MRERGKRKRKKRTKASNGDRFDPRRKKNLKGKKS